MPSKSGGRTPHPPSSRSISGRRSRAWAPCSTSVWQARSSPLRARATLPRLVAVSIPRTVMAMVSTRGHAAAAQELRDLRFLVVPLQQEDRAHLVPLPLSFDLLDADHLGAQGHARLGALVLADDDHLVADGIRPVALEQQAAPTDVQGRMAGARGLQLGFVERLDANRELLARDVEPDVVASFAIIDADRISAARLGLVHRLLRASDQPVGDRGVLGVLGHADRDGHGDRPAVDVPAEEVPLHLLANALRHEKRAHALGLRQDDAELLAGDARRHVDIANLVLDQNGDLAQQDVPDQFAVPLVDLAEIVDVEIQHRQVEAIPLGTADLLLQGGEELARVPQPRAGVDRRGGVVALDQRQVDDARTGQLPVDVDEIVEHRDPQTHVAAERLAQGATVPEDLLPEPASLRFLEPEIGQDEQQRRVDLKSALGADLIQALEDALLVVRVFPQDLRKLLAVARGFFQGDHADSLGSCRTASRAATRSRASRPNPTAAFQGG